MKSYKPGKTIGAQNGSVGHVTPEDLDKLKETRTRGQNGRSVGDVKLGIESWKGLDLQQTEEVRTPHVQDEGNTSGHENVFELRFSLQQYALWLSIHDHI